MAEHTPGPWIVGDGGKSLVVWSDPCGLTVAEARRSADDARLIAAAPELLAELKKLADAHRCRGGGRDCVVCKAAFAAIAKAEGRVP